MRRLGTLTGLLLCLSIVVSAIGCSDRKTVDSFETASTPIQLTGHGQFFGPSGESVQPTKEDVLRTQKVLISKWSERLGVKAKPVGASVGENHATLDNLLKNAVAQQLPGATSDRQVNNAFLWLFGEDGNIVQQELSTEATGGAYIEQCISNGVPVPDMVLSEDWLNHGSLQDPFVSTGLEAEVWSWESADPDGICMALPRWDGNNEARLFGIICLGRQTSKVCYFDNPTTHPEYDAFYADREESGGYPIGAFIGGADLDRNAGGMCSDCHAGANPFVIHPEEPAFIDLKNATTIFPANWPEPIVHPSWVQNPGPLGALPPSSTGSSCESCHGPTGGRFPLITSALPGYCRTVLDGALSNYTMPPGGQNPALYASHAGYLQSLCNNPPVFGPGSGTTVNNPPGNTVSFLSPPILVTPIYECATTVGVRGARLNATVDVYVNGNIVATDVIRSPSHQPFTVPALSQGDDVWATQTVGGTTSAASNVVTVRDYTEDYPQGLPEPWIEPGKVHECAYRIAVRHVEGATLHVVTNGGSPRANRGGPRGWTVASGDGPFSVGDRLEVYQELCGDTSSVSPPVFAQPEPAFIRSPQLDPPSLYDQQELLHVTSIVEGATVDIAEASAGNLGRIFSWPVTRYWEWDIGSRLGRPLSTGDNVYLQQTLCTSSDETSVPVTKTCEDLEQPDVAPPIAGQDFIVISNAAPGASIRVYDSNGNEIGDGGGSIILLSRPLVAGESIIVVQELNEECVASTGVSLVVNEGDGTPIGSGGEGE